ncbi:Peroxidase mlt-7 [Trichinella britovi]|uniref:peroxidase n=1 Tax=Trichinella britovi TaxID=45882 RepID=A0A0V1CT01_TRIBR|nr:Peroxidase mlt-7 [Trichinella britovi]
MILDNINVGYKTAAATAATSLTFSVEILRNIGMSKMHDFHIQAITFCLLGSFIGDESILDNLLGDIEFLKFTGLLSHGADPITKNFRCISANCCDQHEWCGFWAGIGECETNEKWMIGNCQISCKKCDDVNSTTAAPVTESVGVPTSDKGNSTLPRLKLRRGNDPLFCADMLRLNGSERFQEMVRNEAIVVFEDMMMNNQMMGCFREQESGDCSRNLCFHAMYRTLDGTCNNLRSPLVGAAGTAFNPIRLGSRPSAREATRFLLSSPQLVTSGKWNMLLMQFGQFIVHDISKTSLLPADRCGSCTDIPGRCFPIKVETVDPRFGCVRPPCCLFFTRSSPLCGTGAQSKREQVNENTAFLDGSAIYSSSLPDSLRLKDSKTGMMRITFFNNHVMPPFDPHTCFGPNNCNANFDIGDNRASIFIALVGVHTVFLREHNRIAEQFLAMNPTWSVERVFQETRKIIGAMIQAITYKEWLPKILGIRYNSLMGNYTGYNPNVNPSIINEFTTAAMRFGHGMITEFYERVDEHGKSIPHAKLRFDQGVLKPAKLLFEGGIEPVIRGLLMMEVKKPQRVTSSVTENMFGSTDLASTNVQRGRDHGLGSYNDYREFCGLKKALTFDELSSEILDPNLRNNLQQSYKHTDHIDLYVGGLIEEPVVDGLVGPTFACLIAEQFRRLRDGDRFFYQNPEIFKPDQLAEIEKVSMSKLLCENLKGFSRTPKDGFAVMKDAEAVACSSLPSNINVGYKTAAATAATSLTFSVEILRNIGMSKMHDFHIQAITFCLLGSFIGLLSHGADPITKNFRCISANCCDQHEWCGFWAGIGECETNKNWMTRNCQISCKKCDDTNTIVNSTTAAPVTESAKAKKVSQPSVSTTKKQTAAPPRQMLRRGHDPLFCAEMLRLNGSERFQEMSRNGAIVVFEDATSRRLLSARDMVTNNQMMGCFREQDTSDCSRNMCFHAMYRTLDGTCNNLRNPLIGAAGTTFNRILPAVYEDGITTRPGSRPSAREATRFLLSSPQLVTSSKGNMLLMPFGQFIVHDISRTSLLPADRCGSCTDIPGRCFPIKVETVDPRFGCARPPCCLFFTRSSPLCGTGAQSKREQVNENTAFLDGSAIYSSSLPDSLRLKDSKTGMMRITFFNNHVMPPFNPHTCFGPNNCNANLDVGDNRGTLFLSLVGVHAVFLREHNRIAQQLLKLNPSWSAERVFQETRKIVGSIIQAITYKEYLPKILGIRYNSLMGNYTGYNPNVNPSIINEFTTAAMRFGHAMITEFYERADEHGNAVPNGKIRFDQGVLRPARLLFEGGIEPVMRGHLIMEVKRPQRVTTSVTENMFGSTDLASTNVQRGRDHGLPSYNKYREFCGLKKARTFDDLSNEILDPNLRNNLHQTYKHTDHIDLYVGGLLEDPVIDGLVGPTFACLIAEQFRRLRDGDRFFYQNPEIFRPDQLAEIEKVSMSKLLCDNMKGISKVPKDAFTVMKESEAVSCSSLPSMNLSKWATHLFLKTYHPRVVSDNRNDQKICFVQTDVG